MIGAIVLFCVIISLISFLAWALEDTGIGALYLIAGLIVFAICSIILYSSSKYPQAIETLYPINIAPNHVAYICKDAEIYNVSCKIKQNLTEKDMYVEKVYPGYWAGYVYVEEKVEVKILREGDILVP